MVAATKAPSYIAPERLYALKGFEVVSGISATRRREAKAAGINLAMLSVGRRRFVRGYDAIDYIERLAKLEQEKEQK